MAISNYSDLQTTVIGYCIREGDADFAAALPLLIQQAEAALNRMITNRRMEDATTITLTAGTATAAMPTDLLEVRALTITDGLSPSLGTADLSIMSQYGTRPARPEVYTISGTNFRFAPIPDQNYPVELVFKKAIPALSAENPTNWLLAGHPDIYLLATLIEANTWLASDTRTPLFAEKLALAIDTLKKADRRASWQSGPLVSRVDYCTP